MASIQARHHPSCVLGEGKWRFKKAGAKGCTCPRAVGPVYYVHYRESGKAKYEHVGMNLEVAKRVTRLIEGRVDEAKVLARLGSRPREREDATFNAWADRWFDGLTRPKENTKRSYVPTLNYARDAFGDRIVRVLDVQDIEAFLKVAKLGLEGTQRRAFGKPASDSTLAKHLRVLSSCLDAAINAGLANTNPVRQLPRSHRPTGPAETVPAYFTDAELAKLWLAMPKDLPAAVFMFLCKLSLTTGMRQGELLGLRWSDVKLLDSEIELKRTYTRGLDAKGRAIGETTPKSGKSRTIDLTPPARRVLEDWLKLSGARSDSNELVFPREGGEHLVLTTILRGSLYPAMRAAGIPRGGEHGRNRDFHSFRHTFARIALQGGAIGDAAEITWVQRQLGHSSITLTVDRYGRWDRKGEKRQAKALESAFAGVV